MTKLSRPDWSGIDPRIVGTEQWEAVKREIIRNAREQRARAVGELLQGLGRWLLKSWRRRDPAVQPLRSPRAHALHWSGRA